MLSVEGIIKRFINVLTLFQTKLKKDEKLLTLWIKFFLKLSLENIRTLLKLKNKLRELTLSKLKVL